MNTYDITNTVFTIVILVVGFGMVIRALCYKHTTDLRDER